MENEFKTIDDMLLEIDSEASANRWRCPSLRDIPPLVPEDEDPTILFRNNWLAQGQGITLVGSSGIGKSSMNMQISYHWAAGKPFLAEPRRPLKIAIIQTEDSPRDIGEQREGMRRGLHDAGGWTGDEITAAEDNILMPQDFLGLQGDKFIKLLGEFQGDMKCDILSINPVQGVFGAELNDQKEVSHFLREGLDPILKSDHHPCCALLVEHTPKQKSGNKEGRSSVDDYGEYMMAGSQEWTAWSRAVIAFLKRNGKDGIVDLTCPKRGNRLKWPKPKRCFRFATGGYIYWEEVTETESITEMTREDISAIAAERKRNDQGIDANVRYLASQCGLLFSKSRGYYDNAALRKFARSRWTKDVADAAVKKFNENLGLLEFECVDGMYMKREWKNVGGGNNPYEGAVENGI